MSLLLANATVLDWRSGCLYTSHLKVDPGPSGGIERLEALPPVDARSGLDVLDCSGKLVTRAFGIGHHHLYSALARGMPGPSSPPRSFVEILEKIWWNLDKQLDSDMIRACAWAGALDALKSGVTFIIDHHASPRSVSGSLFILAEVLEEAGLGHLLCYELSDRDGPASRADGLEETDAYLASGRSGLVGLHASFTVSDGLLQDALSLAEKHHTGIHIHVAEAQSDQEHCLATHGCRVVERLARAGALSSSMTLLAHCLHLSLEERALIQASPVWVAQNAESNLNNAVGRFDPAGLGERILIGTDGMHSDALRSARAAFLTGQPGTSMVESYRRLRNLHHYLKAAQVPGDGENNLVVLDYDPPTPITDENWLGHLFYALERAQVEHVIAQGCLRVRGRQVVGVDEAAINAFTRAQARRLWQRL